MFNFRDEYEIKRDMLSNIKNTTDKSENSLVHDALSPAAIEFMNAYVQLDYVAGKIDVENLEGLELETFILQRTGVKKKLSTKSLTTVIVSGTEGSVISKGDMFSTQDQIVFESLEDVTVDGTGRAEIVVICTIEGSTGNVPANTITKMPVSIQGIVDVYNENEVKTGYDEEADDELRQRYYDKLQRPGKSGNKYHYIEWAKELSGVGDARVIPVWDGPLTVKVIIIDFNKDIAGVELVDQVKDYIESQKPFGATVTVVSANAKNLSISFSLTLLDGYDQLEVKNNIEDNIKSHLKELAFKSDYISYAKIGSIILDTNGVLDYSNLKINNVLSNIAIGEEEIAVLSDINIV